MGRCTERCAHRLGGTSEHHGRQAGRKGGRRQRNGRQVEHQTGQADLPEMVEQDRQGADRSSNGCRRDPVHVSKEAQVGCRHPRPQPGHDGENGADSRYGKLKAGFEQVGRTLEEQHVDGRTEGVDGPRRSLQRRGREKQQGHNDGPHDGG